ncbi:hypothetical protein J3R83DRAFT_4380 [Lanmaoa asiatica]|nr:hypothetical protein J3R83DRAFT_4380 [Lanmaoa asiatica]
MSCEDNGTRGLKPPITPGMRPSTQPEGTSASRAMRAQSHARSRLARTAKLDKYVPIMNGRCVDHLVFHRKLAKEHFPAPCHDESSSGYKEFRLRFKFCPFTYCFVCGLPQDQNWNGEGPRCHRLFTPGGQQKCPFGNIIFKTAFVLGLADELRQQLCRELQLTGNSFEEYLDWVVSEEREGQYHNAIEAFLWLCESLEAESPSIFY